MLNRKIYSRLNFAPVAPISLEQLLRPFTPINSFVKEPVERVITNRPDVGIRWGKPSKFEFLSGGISLLSSLRVEHPSDDDRNTDPGVDDNITEGDVPTDEEQEENEPNEQVKREPQNDYRIEHQSGMALNYKLVRKGNAYIREMKFVNFKGFQYIERERIIPGETFSTHTRVLGSLTLHLLLNEDEETPA